MVIDITTYSLEHMLTILKFSNGAQHQTANMQLNAKSRKKISPELFQQSIVTVATTSASAAHSVTTNPHPAL
jgi:hypothetical protein